MGRIKRLTTNTSKSTSTAADRLHSLPTPGGPELLAGPPALALITVDGIRLGVSLSVAQRYRCHGAAGGWLTDLIGSAGSGRRVRQTSPQSHFESLRISLHDTGSGRSRFGADDVAVFTADNKSLTSWALSPAGGTIWRSINSLRALALSVLSLALT